MNVPPFLENLLLSNEAVFKVATLGLSGQNFIPVPEGKTAVILEIDIQPFFNYVNSNYLQNWEDGVFPGNLFAELIRRMMFQLQIINDSYNTNLSYHNDFAIDWHEPQGGNSSLTVNLKFTGRKDSVFIYTDKGLYFNLIYPYLNNGAITTGISIAYTTPNLAFSPVEQNLPEKPITFYKSNFQDFVAGVNTNAQPGPVYSPINRNTIAPFLLPLNEFFKLQAENTGFAPTSGVSIEIPVNSGEEILFSAFFQLPVINIKYALINKRAADYGLTKGK